MAPDAGVIAEGVGQQTDVGTRGLAYLRDRVDERNLGSQKGIGGDLDQFRGLQIGHQEGQPGLQQRSVKFSDELLGQDRILLHTKHNPIRTQRIADRETFAQKLRVPGDLHANAGHCQPGRPPGQLGRRSDRNRRFANEHRRSGQPRHQGIDDGVNVAQVGAVFPPFLGCANTQKVHIGELGGHVVVGREVQTSSSKVVPQQLSQTRLVEGDIAPGQLGHLARINVDPDNLVPKLRHSNGVGGA